MTDTPMEKINGVFPVLDVSRYFAGDAGDLPRLGRELRYAFENVGFYYLRGHDVAHSLIDATFAQAERFHAQPMERKLALRINEHNIGYMPMGGSLARSSTVNNNTRPSVNEAYFLRRERAADDPDVIELREPRAATGKAECLHHVEIVVEGIDTRTVDLPQHVHAVAAHFLQRHGHHRARHELLQAAHDLHAHFLD